MRLNFVKITSLRDWQLLVYVVSWKLRRHLKNRTETLIQLIHFGNCKSCKCSVHICRYPINMQTHSSRETLTDWNVFRDRKAPVNQSREHTSLYMLFKPSKELGEQRVIIPHVRIWMLTTCNKNKNELDQATTLVKIPVLLSADSLKTPTMYRLTWYDRSSLTVWSLQATRTSWAGHCGLFIALAVSNCSPLLYSLSDRQTEHNTKWKKKITTEDTNS